jgi:uncharacterized protein (TIGR00730 family)
VHTVCVFSGSSAGARPGYTAAARALGEELVARELRLVYGGANVGLMAVLADTVLAAGGSIIGVIPQHLVDQEIAHPGLSELRIVGSMHERKAVMSELSDGFIALPGGYGTLDEFAEVLTWSQLGLQHKPCGLLDIDAFYTDLLAFFDHAATERFIPAEHRGLVLAAADPAQLLDALARWKPPGVGKWMDRRPHRADRR